jgi:HlyD family secretion protein
VSTFISRRTLFIALPIVAVLAVAAYFTLRGKAVQGYVVQQSKLVQQVVATGRVAAKTRAQVGSEITAVVAQRHVDVGDHVARGDLLLTLRADDLAAQYTEAKASLELLEKVQRPEAAAKLAQAMSQLKQAQREVDRRRILSDARAVPTENFEQAVNALNAARAGADQARLEVESLAPGGRQESIVKARLDAARARLDKTLIKAEFDGVILERMVSRGDVVQAGKALLTLRRDRDVELRIPVDERNLAVLAVGQPAVALTDAYPQRPFNTHITLISPAIDSQRGTVEVRLSVDDPVPDFLRDDMTVTVTVQTGERDKALVIPNDALQSVSGSQATVLVAQGGRAQQKSVSLGLRSLALSEVTKGLAAGDVVIASGQVNTNQKVRVNTLPLPTTAGPNGARTNNELPVKFN